jgi:NADH:ubiquinone oxidoreductase subunit 5 (subunit L)/multisubunit Na+/H+ antiporter MnhA subunit
MEGPTPVSALIHAATMVTAGVFLIIRCSPIFEYAPNVLIFMTIIGSFTCLFAATVGLAQLDIKKVIAYSTCSQLGYMIFTCGLSSYDISFCHLANHAGFKGLLFLCSGGIIHANKDEQNMHKLGGLLTTLPFIYSTMVLGSLALAGFPYLAGYYSKDIILENAYINSYFSIDGSIPIIFGTISAALTAAYSIRTLELTFYKNIKLPYLITKNIHEVQYPTIISLLILSIFSIFSGYFWSEFSSFGTDI